MQKLWKRQVLGEEIKVMLLECCEHGEVICKICHKRDYLRQEREQNKMKLLAEEFNRWIKFHGERLETLIKNPKLINCKHCWEIEYSDCGGHAP